jgi:hypothetical protein
MEKLMEGMENRLQQSNNQLNNQLKGMKESFELWRQKVDNDIATLQSNQINLNERVSALEGADADLDREKLLKDVRDEFQEQRQKIIRLNNIVLMGVEESANGVKLAEELLKLIVPNWVGPLVEIRVGDPAGKLPRPIRVSLSNLLQKTATLKNCKQLKNRAEFNKISVRKDLTKKEQAEWREKAKDRAGGRKRKLSGLLDGESQSDKRILRQRRVSDGMDHSSQS